MESPFSMSSKAILLSTPEYDWELVTNGANVYVNEGPEILKKGDDIFLIYSAAFCMTDNYTLGK